MLCASVRRQTTLSTCSRKQINVNLLLNVSDLTSFCVLVRRPGLLPQGTPDGQRRGDGEGTDGDRTNHVSQKKPLRNIEPCASAGSRSGSVGSTGPAHGARGAETEPRTRILTPHHPFGRVFADAKHRRRQVAPGSAGLERVSVERLNACVGIALRTAGHVVCA